MSSWWPSVQWQSSKLSTLSTPILEGVVAKVASTSVAVEIVAPASLTVVDVKEVLLAAYQLVLWGGEDLREQSSEFCSVGVPVID